MTAPVNYEIREVTFRVVREAAQPDPRKLSDPHAVFALVAEDNGMIPDDAREHFLVLMLDAQNGLIAWHRASTGTLSGSLVHPREVFGPALRAMGVASIILVHNHPSGDPTPSAEDIKITRRLRGAGELLDLPVHDHVVIGRGRYVSMAERGVL